MEEIREDEKKGGEKGDSYVHLAWPPLYDSRGNRADREGMRATANWVAAASFFGARAPSDAYLRYFGVANHNTR